MQSRLRKIKTHPELRPHILAIRTGIAPEFNWLFQCKEQVSDKYRFRPQVSPYPTDTKYYTSVEKAD